MRDGVLVHRTRRRRVAVREDVLPELVALLGMHLVWAMRELTAAVETAHLNRSEGNAGAIRRAGLLVESLEQVIARAGDTFDEVEYQLCLVSAQESVRTLMAKPRKRGGRRIGVPANVHALASPGGSRPDGPRHDLRGLQGRATAALPR